MTLFALKKIGENYAIEANYTIWRETWIKDI